MAIPAYVSALFAFANLFIAIFVMIYAYMFLKKTNKHRDRRPWDFLFISSFFFLLYQIFSILVITGITQISAVDLTFVTNGTSFVYAGCILLAFVSQHDLILRSHLILISKKDEKKESEIEIDIGKKGETKNVK